jgi:hypothetical protein
MFGSGMVESTAVNEESTVGGMVDIVVPDSLIGLLRFLIDLYPDILPDGSDGALLEDFMSADRYQYLMHYVLRDETERERDRLTRALMATKRREDESNFSIRNCFKYIS